MTDGCNCSVLQTDDHSHVSKITPLQIKRKELAEAAALVEPAERKQEIQNSSVRQQSHLRPAGGSK